ncbi:acyl-CoA dehydrogenase [bacterium]|nr:acyl-CoA dehydrogenase [bacterium]
MNFSLTEEQQLVQEMVRDFAQNEIAPYASQREEAREWPQETIKKMSELNLLGMIIPEKYGGAGMDHVSYVLALEEIGAACASTACIVSVHTSVGTYPIYQFGNDFQKEKFLIPLAKGDHIGAFALTEANAGSDVTMLETVAIKENAQYRLNGRKIFITNGSKANTVIVFAMTEKEKGYKGITAFIVEKGTQGFSIGKKEHKLGQNASETVELIFDDCLIPCENLLGNEGEGFKIAMTVLDGGRISIAAMSVGIARAAYEAAVKYANERVQFGKPISSFQAIQWKIADMDCMIDSARLLTLRAAQMKDAGKKFTTEAAMAKLVASETANKCAYEAIQIFGAYGYSKEFPVERYFRDARATTIYEGTSEIQKLVIARDTIKKFQ